MLKSLATVKKFKRKVRKVLRKEKQRESVILSVKSFNAKFAKFYAKKGEENLR